MRGKTQEREEQKARDFSREKVHVQGGEGFGANKVAIEYCSRSDQRSGAQ